MARLPIDSNEIKVGDPTKKELWDKVKGNDDDHEARINLLEGGTAKVDVFNDLVLNAAQYVSTATYQGLAYYRADRAFTLIAAVLTQFDHGESGTLEIDLQKSAGPDGPFVSVFNTKPSIASNGSDLVVVDYTQLSGATITVTINGTPTVLTEGVDWTAATSNNATAASIQSAVDALTGVTATVLTNTVSVDADDTYQATIASSDAVNLTVSQASIAGTNVESNNADFLTVDVSQGDYLRLDQTSFQTVQKRYHIHIFGEVS